MCTPTSDTGFDMASCVRPTQPDNLQSQESVTLSAKRSEAYRRVFRSEGEREGEGEHEGESESEGDSFKLKAVGLQNSCLCQSCCTTFKDFSNPKSQIPNPKSQIFRLKTQAMDYGLWTKT
jgi:hypothetical protein